jgi:hypothetical protein
MAAGGRKVNTKRILSTTGWHHLKTLDLESRQIAVEKNEWNYNEFVARLLEIIVVLRTGNKQKNVPLEK